MKADVILWDYDGTLVNSVPKNIDITKQILSIVAPHLTGENLPGCLKSEAAYHEVNHNSKNWQDLYKNYYGLNDGEITKAGKLWAAYQLKNNTPVSLFPGIEDLINELSWLPHGICSQNSADNIRNVLEDNKMNEHFKAVIGYNDVANDAQKPLPESGIKCLANIFGETKDKLILYIGDHEGDVRFARNLASKLCKSNKVISLAATYSGATPDSWFYKPDFTLSTPVDLLKIVEH